MWDRNPENQDVMAVYLDCAATTPIDPRVYAVVTHYLAEEFGNSGSRTHEYGIRARRAVEKARDQVAQVVGASRGEVTFTSGATESNNLALLGLAPHGLRSGRRHIVSTRIEHHAVLEPLAQLREQGFEITLVEPNAGGWIDPASVLSALRRDTLLVSVMHVNNETGVIQPLARIAELLDQSPVYFHADAAQGFGKDVESLRNRRIDLISISGHKIHAPKGVGALVARRRNGERPPLAPLMYGGGQERGLRSGTLPVHLIAGLGLAAELALEECENRAQACREFGGRLMSALEPFHPRINGDPARRTPNILNLSFPDLDAEVVIEAWKDLVAVSNGAACTSQSYTCSHVLSAMGLDRGRMDGAIRFSWSHLTEAPDLARMVWALHELTL
jgi:cysteine desulfurase